MTDPLAPKLYKISFAKAWGYYLTALALFLIVLGITYKLDIPWLAMIPYLIAGIILNRLVLRNLVAFHPIYDTLANVSNTKLAAVVAWPFFYLTILIKLAIIKYL